MTDGQEPAGTTGAGRSVRRSGARRVGRWCAAVVLVGTAATMGANPAVAAGKPHATLVDHPQKRPVVIKPGHTGWARIQLKNTDRKSARNDARMYMEIWAPYGTRFTDTRLTPLHGALGGWACKGDAYRRGVPYESTILRCFSDRHGRVARAGGTATWQLKMKVVPGTRAGTTLSRTPYNQGAVLHFSYHGKAVWTTMSLKVRTPGKPRAGKVARRTTVNAAAGHGNHRNPRNPRS
ncbi:hypothetical protein [Streptomyces roseochromogenus]|uniref:Uncharacterized protein n=1 Tax=Streptomyces roseochromogenus subsp. oscitans DS 12.976 TaxID=1352936 RepID=V6JVQ2_STRRC|nr:hypothetical protein [Streptomyces roseochromogenus]EST23773.1 hypothetical protein M878_32640 [Streptomyces roseochromogenus subsp. oscitans DS 12.976]